jgi:hypothetical protein
MCALDRRVWIVFDDCTTRAPVLAWVGFRRQAETGLHLPVTCELRAYHLHAGLIMGRALEAVARTVERRRSRSEASANEHLRMQ